MISGTIANSGSISGTGGTAIAIMGASTDTITLSGASIIDSIISIADLSAGASQDNLVLDPSLMIDAALTFNSSTTVDNLDITENGHQVVRLGNQVLIANTTSEAGTDGSIRLFTGDTTSVLLNTLAENTGAGFSSANSGGGSTFSYGLGAQKNDGKHNKRGWISGFGGLGKSAGDGNQMDLDHGYGGVMGGIETSYSNIPVGGYFAGWMSSNIQPDSVNGSAWWLGRF